jgi:chemotaxis protein methyltransferase CheR
MFELSENDRIRLSGFIERRYGIQMPASKKILLQTRLQKRAMQLEFNSLHRYVDYIFSPEGQKLELDRFATIVSTHKTDFFREAEHFSLLKGFVLPEIIAGGFVGDTETLVAWSAASSTGEEVYSIAMSVHSVLKRLGRVSPAMKIIGTDLSETIVEFARKGIYPDQALAQIPAEYRCYLMRSRDPKRRAIRIIPELRALTDFRPQNLIDTRYKVKKGIHIIFCRNVLIYFDRPTQSSIIARLVDLLAPGGFLLIGHSESISGMELPIEQVRPTVFRKLKG